MRTCPIVDVDGRYDRYDRYDRHTGMLENDGNQPTSDPPECGKSGATNQVQSGCAGLGLQLGKTLGCQQRFLR